MGEAKKKVKNTVDDHGSSSKIKHDKVVFDSVGDVIVCWFCGEPGQVVSEFPRRGYG